MKTATTMKNGERATVHTATYLRPSQAEALKAFAAAQDRPVGSVIRIAIERLLAAEAGQ